MCTFSQKHTLLLQKSKRANSLIRGLLLLQSVRHHLGLDEASQVSPRDVQSGQLRQAGHKLAQVGLWLWVFDHSVLTLTKVQSPVG